MPNAIISDSSCLVLLQNIGALDLLHRVYGSILTTPTVAAEVRFSLPDWIEIRQPVSADEVARLAKLVDPGEASAIALAIETDGSTIILDDLKARKLAVKLGLDLTGTVGVILKAKNDGIISEIRPFILSIRKTNFRLSKQLEQEALKLAGEVEI